MTGFLATNWLWIGFGVVLVAMHGRRGCGMHGHHQHHRESPERDSEHARHPVGEGTPS